MGIRTVYDSRGNPVDVWVDGGDIHSVELTVAAGWVEIPVPETCDLYRVRVPDTGKRVRFTSTVAIPNLDAGDAVDEAHLAKSEIVDPGIWKRGCDRKKGVRFFFALDPTDDADQPDPTVLIFTEAALTEA